MKRVFIIVLILATLGVLFWYTIRGSESPEDYQQKILHEREEKDLEMRNAADSPFADAKDQFTGLKYFAPDIHYRIRARLTPIENKKMISLPTSDGKNREYLEFGNAEFDWDGIPCKLLILEVMEPGRNYGILFLAFADETSARETYGAGRYLEVKKVKGATSIELDFNKCYNPYCAYSKKYSCPFPPHENILHIPITAGEKSYSDRH